MRRYYNKGAKGLSGGQVKLDKMGNNDGKISGEDFAVMRSRKMGGGMMKRPMYKEGTPKRKGKDIMSTFIADDARSVAGKSGGADSGKAGEMRSKLGKQDVQMKKNIKNKIKKTKETIKKFAKKTKDTLKAPIIAFHKKAEENYKKYPDKRVRIFKDPSDKTKKAMGGRIKKMGGGSLKSVPAGNKGLKKLPTQVRNKMGFMKKGGVVSDTKKKQFKANQAGSMKMAKKVLTDNLAGDIYKDKRVRKFASKVKEGLKNSPLNLKGAAEGYINLGKKIARKFKGDE